jgi:hypothetical protein
VVARRLLEIVMRKMILALLMLALTAPLWAQVTKTASWNAPTARVNGDALTLAEIAGYDLECSRTSGEVVYSAEVPTTPSSHQTGEVFDSGEFVCRMRTKTTDGLQSVWGSSNVFTVGRCDVTDCSPMPPTSITVFLP